MKQNKSSVVCKYPKRAKVTESFYPSLARKLLPNPMRSGLGGGVITIKLICKKRKGLKR
jgi:hypothetical protein